jgi:hypothetical protein
VRIRRDALAQRRRFEGTVDLEGAEVVGQEVGQPALHAVIGLVPFEHLELDLKRTAGPPLRPAKQRNQVRRQRQGVGIGGQTPRHHFFTMIPLDQQLGR